MGKNIQRFFRGVDIAGDTLHNVNLRYTFLSLVKGRNRYLKKHFPDRPGLTAGMKRDYRAYYRSFGFRGVRTDWAEYIYRTTGVYDRRIVPDDLFNTYIDSPYTVDREAWQNKALQPRIFPEARFPQIILKRLNGYYLDGTDRLLSEDEALRLIKGRKEVVIKHAIGGAGTDIGFYSADEVTAELLRARGHDFVVQEIIEQSSLMAGFNPGCVNIIKFTSFLFEGEVHILSARLWCGGIGTRLSNSAGGRGAMVPLDRNGKLGKYSISLNGERKEEAPSGLRFEGIDIGFYRECVDLIRKGHRRLLYFPFISWDFTQDKNGHTILIEYNLKWHVLSDIQLLAGPAFGEFTDRVLEKAVQDSAKNNSLLFKPFGSAIRKKAFRSVSTREDIKA